MDDRISRRDFVNVSFTALGGLAIGVRVERPHRQSSSPAVLAPNAFVRIEPSGIVVVTVPRPEMGQGSRTAIAMLVAEELDAAWERVRVEQGDLDEARYGEQYAGGSAVVRTSWMPLRKAGAAARLLLVGAAAEQWRVDPAQCATDRGQVRHPASGRTASYASLVGSVRSSALPADIPLKPRREFRIIGTPRRGIDVPAIVTGRATFG